MSIKKFYATADTTITNAYKEDISTRATDSNMGLADSLELLLTNTYELTKHFMGINANQPNQEADEAYIVY